ncbi:MAG: hypothetical protein CSA97_00350 [Bacteroidetes bacterium]|nr:MAG: hypothetical protein CSA97_00350 [Bacteroidota bacterium]
MPLPGVYEKVYHPLAACQYGYSKSYRYNEINFGFDEPTSGERGISVLYISINGGRKNLLEMTSVLNPEYQEYERVSVRLNGGRSYGRSRTAPTPRAFSWRTTAY